jgi:hypothetical protein
MSKLIDLVRGESRRRNDLNGSDDMLVVIITNLTGNVVPHAHIGGILVEKAPKEPFEVFEARAVSTAKASGLRYMAITVPAENHSGKNK